LNEIYFTPLIILTSFKTIYTKNVAFGFFCYILELLLVPANIFDVNDFTERLVNVTKCFFVEIFGPEWQLLYLARVKHTSVNCKIP